MIIRNQNFKRTIHQNRSQDLRATKIEKNKKIVMKIMKGTEIYVYKNIQSHQI